MVLRFAFRWLWLCLFSSQVVSARLRGNRDPAEDRHMLGVDDGGIMSEEKLVERLRVLLVKVDTNGDGKLSQEELKVC